MLSSHEDLARKLAALEGKYDKQFKVVFDALRQLMTPPDKDKPKKAKPEEAKAAAPIVRPNSVFILADDRLAESRQDETRSRARESHVQRLGVAPPFRHRTSRGMMPGSPEARCAPTITAGSNLS